MVLGPIDHSVLDSSYRKIFSAHEFATGGASESEAIIHSGASAKLSFEARHQQMSWGGGAVLPELICVHSNLEVGPSSSVCFFSPYFAPPPSPSLTKYSIILR